MISIEHTLVSDEVIAEQFVCDLLRCKGGCCVDGDAGAPLEDEERDMLREVYPEVKHLLSAEAQKKIAEDGIYAYDQEFGWVTPVISSGMCAFGIKGQNDIVKCGIEHAYNAGKISWKKPISCHLFPIRIKKSKSGKTEYVNYEPRPDLCKAGCKLGKSLKVPVYNFLKDALTRKFGAAYYEALSATAAYLSGK